MTRLPIDSRNVAGVRGDLYPMYELNVFCPVPGCPRDSHDPHHIWRRSFLGGDYWWVRLPDGEEVGNVVGICRMHHDELTTNRSNIEYEDGIFYWNTLISARQKLGWQPPFHGSEFTTQKEVSEAVHDHRDNETCPTCLRPMPRPKPEGAKNEEKRERKTWSVAVPKDVIEDGAEVLDKNLEAVRDELAMAGMPYGDSATAKYYVLSTAIALFLTHSKEIL